MTTHKRRPRDFREEYDRAENIGTRMALRITTQYTDLLEEGRFGDAGALVRRVMEWTGARHEQYIDNYDDRRAFLRHVVSSRVEHRLQAMVHAHNATVRGYKARMDSMWGVTPQPAPEQPATPRATTKRQWSEWAEPTFTTGALWWSTDGETRVLLYRDGSWLHLRGSEGSWRPEDHISDDGDNGRSDWRPSYYRYARANNLPLPPTEWYAPPEPEPELPASPRTGPDKDGWYSHDASGRPVGLDDDERVEFRTRSGGASTARAVNLNWRKRGGATIVRWRRVTPTTPTEQP